MVIENRRSTVVELLAAYDQTPGTWMWYWDNDIKEDARFSGFLNFVYRNQPTSRDATIGFDEYEIYLPSLAHQTLPIYGKFILDYPHLRRRFSSN